MIRPHPLTPSQQMALDSRRNIAVSASAGSGKTATLVERYIELMRCHADVGPGQILAITFTQKAAAEMRERVARRLRQALAQEADERQRQRLGALYEDLPQSRICTIHAFCAALLREHPLEAGVDPAFSVLEQIEAQLLRREAARQTLEEVADRPAGDADREALRRLLGEWERRYLEAVLNDLLGRKRLARLWCRRYALLSPEQILAEWRAMLGTLQQSACRALLEDARFLPALRALCALEPHTAEASDTAEKLLAPARAASAALLADPRLSQAVEILPRLARALLKTDGAPYSAARLGSKRHWEADALSRLRALYPEVAVPLAAQAEPLRSATGPVDVRAAEVVAALSRLLLLAESRCARLQGEGARLDFDDLQERVLELFERHPEIARRQAERYRFAMVDEFQDTDPLQWALIRPLVSADGRLAADKLFVVGDPKQSIYSFRDADVAVFARVRQEILRANDERGRGQVPFLDDGGAPLESAPAERLGGLSMAENFRTLAAPIAFANHLFAQFMRPIEGEDFQVEYEPLVCRRDGGESRGSVELLLSPIAEDEDDGESLQREAELLARRLRLLLDGDDLPIAGDEGLRPPRPGDVAILLRRRRNLGAYDHALRAFGIPFQIAGGLGFYQRQEVYDLANILRLLHNPRDEVALLGALRSPYFGLSDNALYALTRPHGGRLREHLHAARSRQRLAPADRLAAEDAVQRLARWESLRDRVPLVELLHAILEESGAWGVLHSGERGLQNAANMRKLLALARAHAGGLADFTAHLDLLIAEEEKEGEAALETGGDAVHILTVHAAKGLEFPVVAVPDLDAPFNLSRSGAALVDPERGIGLNVLDPEQDYKRAPSLVRRLIGEGHRRRGLAEEKRLFYVAATRARDHLLLSGRMRPEHLQPPPFEACRDRLSWLCRGLELEQGDLERGEKTFAQDGESFVLRLHTDAQRIPTRPRRARAQAPACRDLWEEFSQGKEVDAIRTWPAALEGLQPLEDASFRPSYAATELALFERDPEQHFRQCVLGLPPADPARRRALCFGALAHAALDDLLRFPAAEDAGRAAFLLARAPLPDEEWRAPLLLELERLLERFRRSPFGAQVLADAQARSEQPFVLDLESADLAGVVDLIRRGADGLWELVDYKTDRLPRAELAAQARRHRRQLQIYALCLRLLHPGQPEYRASVYFTALDAIHTFRFSPADLQQAQAEIEDLLARLALTY